MSNRIKNVLAISLSTTFALLLAGCASAWVISENRDNGVLGYSTDTSQSAQNLIPCGHYQVTGDVEHPAQDGGKTWHELTYICSTNTAAGSMDRTLSSTSGSSAETDAANQDRTPVDFGKFNRR